jgi:hypothetical protein
MADVALADGGWPWPMLRWPLIVGRWPEETMREETLFEGLQLLIE